MKQSDIKRTSFIPADTDRIMEMAWEDRTPFEAIRMQFGLQESEVRAFMRKNLRFKSYILWRKRVEEKSSKHLSKRNPAINRFKSSRQKPISGNKIT